MRCRARSRYPGLALTMSAAPFKGEKSKASIQVVVEARGSQLPLSIAIVAANPDGEIKAEEHGTLDLKAPTASGLPSGEQRVRLVSRLTLQAGRYQLRAAGMDSGGTRGSVHYDLDVPDFAKGPLTLGGVVLASTAAGAAPTSGSDRGWKMNLLPDPPTTASNCSPFGERLVVVHRNLRQQRGKPGDAVSGDDDNHQRHRRDDDDPGREGHGSRGEGKIGGGRLQRNHSADRRSAGSLPARHRCPANRRTEPTTSCGRFRSRYVRTWNREPENLSFVSARRFFEPRGRATPVLPVASLRVPGRRPCLGSHTTHTPAGRSRRIRETTKRQPRHVSRIDSWHSPCAARY